MIDRLEILDNLRKFLESQKPTEEIDELIRQLKALRYDLMLEVGSEERDKD